MPLSKDLAGGGTEADGSKSELYCSLCYKDGKFAGENCTAGEMQDIVERAMKEQGHSWFMRKFARLQIPRLARWKSGSGAAL
jgi:hypothetical protein